MKDKIEMHNVDLKEFVSVVESCKGEVYLITDEGDKPGDILLLIAALFLLGL